MFISCRWWSGGLNKIAVTKLLLQMGFICIFFTTSQLALIFPETEKN
jgi:hypothetical protein